MLTFLLIMIAWFVQMPLWLSIVITVCAGVRFIFKCIYKVAKLYVED